MAIPALDRLDYSTVSKIYNEYITYTEDDARFVHPRHYDLERMTPEMKHTLDRFSAEQVEKKAKREANMKRWGRPDDPRLDPTSDMYDPLKLVYKDEVDNL